MVLKSFINLEALKKVFYIKKPSTSHEKYPYKWHYLIPIENVTQNYDGYKLQYHKFLADHKKAAENSK